MIRHYHHTSRELLTHIRKLDTFIQYLLPGVLMKELSFLPPPDLNPIHLNQKNGYVSEMPFLLLFKLKQLNVVINISDGKRKRITSFESGNPLDERFFCELEPVSHFTEQGDQIFKGQIRAETGPSFPCEALLNLKQRDGYIFC